MSIDILSTENKLMLIGTHQLALGQDILTEETLQVSRALQGHRMYFLPAGGGFIGYKEFRIKVHSKKLSSKQK